MSFFNALSIPEGNVSEITQGANVLWSKKESDKSYTLTLSGITDYGFELVDSLVGAVQRNPDKNLYDGGYRSLNKYEPNSVAAMRIDFSGYPVFNIYIQSWAQADKDYIVATTLDAPEPSETYTMASTSGNQIEYVDFSNYTKVSYPNDGGSHHIYVFYKKNGNQNWGDDWGYVLIEK